MKTARLFAQVSSASLLLASVVLAVEPQTAAIAPSSVESSLPVAELPVADKTTPIKAESGNVSFCGQDKVYSLLMNTAIGLQLQLAREKAYQQALVEYESRLQKKQMEQAPGSQTKQEAVADKAVADKAVAAENKAAESEIEAPLAAPQKP